MIKVIGVQFNSSLKIYDFRPGRHGVDINDWVIVETSQGIEIGRVVYTNKEVSPKELEEPFKEIIRIADEKDLAKWAKMREEGEKFFPEYVEKINSLGLEMKPTAVEFSFDGERAIFYFTAENRVDFRELIKELGRIVKKQVILRQIGPRDEAKMLGGFGVCGQPVCCKRFLTKMTSVTMDMARDQYETNVNANKVTGVCGRLMCCLAFEATKKYSKLGKEERQSNGEQE